MLAFRHDVAVAFDGQALACVAQFIEQRGDGLAGGQLAGFSVQDDLHGGGPSSLAGKDQVPDAVAQAQAARLELGLRPVGRARRVVGRGVLQQRLAAQHFQHLLGIVFPVGRAVDIATGRQAAGQQCDERRLDQAALVVALLGPGVGEIDVHAGQAVRGQHVAHHFHRVVLDDADVRNGVLFDALQQRADAGVEDFHAQEVVRGAGQGDLRRGLAHAEADLQDQRRAAAEGGVHVQALGGIVQRPLVQQGLQRFALAQRDVAPAMHEAADVRRARGGELGVQRSAGLGIRIRRGHGGGVRIGRGSVVAGVHPRDCSGLRRMSARRG